MISGLREAVFVQQDYRVLSLSFKKKDCNVGASNGDKSVDIAPGLKKGGSNPFISVLREAVWI